jgi:hypothetical protein
LEVKLEGEGEEDEEDEDEEDEEDQPAMEDEGGQTVAMAESLESAAALAAKTAARNKPPRMALVRTAHKAHKLAETDVGQQTNTVNSNRWWR